MARKTKPMNADRRIKAMLATNLKGRNPVALALALRNGQGRHKDARKEDSRKACRGKADY
jgi:hypothetical protein